MRKRGRNKPETPQLVVENRRPLWYQTASPEFKQFYGEPPPYERKLRGAWGRYFDRITLERPPLPPPGKSFPEIIYQPRRVSRNDGT